MIKAVFFDNDGVLVDTEKHFCATNQEVFKQHGLDYSEADYVHYALGAGGGTDNFLRSNGFTPDQILEIRSKRNELFLQKISAENSAIAGAKELLITLKEKNIIIGVVTTSYRSMFDIMHQNTGFFPYFDFFITRDDCHRPKPDPEGYLLALKQAGVQLDEAIVVEDSARGITAAKAAGIRCIAVKSKYGDQCDLSAADQFVTSIPELSKIIFAKNK